MAAGRGKADGETAVGLACGVLTFVFWGVAVVYWKVMAAYPPIELLAHRVVWALIILGLLIAPLRRRRRAFRAIFASRRSLALMSLSAVFLAVNWFLFIYALLSDRMLQASLGYYINPLLNVLLGFLFLGERLRLVQKIAVALAAAGVLYLAMAGGETPWLALGMAGSFGGYGLTRKVAGVASVPGLAFECLLLSLPALVFLLYLDGTGAGVFGAQGGAVDLLLACSGVVTAVPLLLFGMAVSRIHLSTIGVLQYITPSCMFVLGVYLYGEPFSPAHRVAFAFIWAALALYAFEGLYAARAQYRGRIL